MTEELDPADTVLAEAANAPTFDHPTRRTLLRAARCGDRGAYHDYMCALLRRAAEAGLAARQPWMRRVDAIQEAVVVLTRLVDDVDVEDPESLFEERIVTTLSSLAQPPGYPPA